MTAILRGNAAFMYAQIHADGECGLMMYPRCHNVTEHDSENVTRDAQGGVCDAYHSSLGTTGDYIAGTCLVFIIFPAVAVNAFVIWWLAARRRTLLGVDYYILTLAVSDLSAPLFAYPLAMASMYSHKWLFGHAGCLVNGFLGFFFGITDIFVLSVLSVSRCLCVCCPLAYSRVTRQKVVVSVLGAVCLAALTALCPLLGWGQYGVEPFGTSCTLNWETPDRSYVTSVFVVCLALPLTVMTVSYGSILHSTNAAARRLRRHGGESRRSRHEIRLIKITLLMTVCFLAAWTPYSVVSMASAYIGRLHISGPASIFPTLLAKTSHLSNPLVYFIMNSRFSRNKPWYSVPLLASRFSSSSRKSRQTSSSWRDGAVRLQSVRPGEARAKQAVAKSMVGAGLLLAEPTLVTNVTVTRVDSDVTSSGVTLDRQSSEAHKDDEQDGSRPTPCTDVSHRAPIDPPKAGREDTCSGSQTDLVRHCEQADSRTDASTSATAPYCNGSRP